MKTIRSGIALALLVTTLLLTACGDGGGGGNSAPATPVLTGHFSLSTPLVAGGSTSFAFPTDTTAKWTQNSAYPTVVNFDAFFASVINGAPDIASAYFHVERDSLANSEYLSFYIHENSHNVWIWGYITGSSTTYICSLSGVNTSLKEPLCSALGITVDWITGTITFTNTPLSNSQLLNSTPDAGIVNGTLKFSPP
jgi:hypothetical protein